MHFVTDHWTLGDVHARSQSYRLKEHHSTDHAIVTVLRFLVMAFRSSSMFLFISMGVWEVNVFIWILSFFSPKFNNSVSRHSLYSPFVVVKDWCAFRDSDVRPFSIPPSSVASLPAIPLFHPFATISNQPSVVIATRNHMLSRPLLFSFPVRLFRLKYRVPF